MLGRYSGLKWPLDIRVVILYVWRRRRRRLRRRRSSVNNVKGDRCTEVAATKDAQ